MLRPRYDPPPVPNWLPRWRRNASARLKYASRARRLQPLWERVHSCALVGMNFGDDNYATNGELWLLDRLAERFGPAPVVFDVGANVGRYSQALLERIPGAQLFAFEPSRAAFDALERALDQRASLFAFALGAEEAKRALYSDRPASEMGSLVRRDLHRFGLAMSEIETVTVRRLDAVCAERGVEWIDLLKIDTEGSDLVVLRGAGRMLGTRIGVIQFEYGGTAIDAHQALRDFFDLLEPSYRIHRLLPTGLWPLDYKERAEIATYANYVALPNAGGGPGAR